MIALVRRLQKDAVARHPRGRAQITAGKRKGRAGPPRHFASSNSSRARDRRAQPVVQEERRRAPLVKALQSIIEDLLAEESSGAATDYRSRMNFSVR